MNERKMDNQLTYQNSLLVCFFHVQSGEDNSSLYTSRHTAPADFETETTRVSHLELL